MTVSRKLVAVFAADVEGYSRLMGVDEVGTLKGLTERRAILDKLIRDHRGRIANTAGDSVLAEFGSAVEAVQCAVEAQTALAEANSGLAPDRRISFRIGIHIGDVMVRAGDLFGDGVNIAARLQSIAKPGAVCISGVTYNQVRKVLPMTFVDLGCVSAWNKDPVFGVIGIQSGPPGTTGPQCFHQVMEAEVGMLVVETIAKIRRAYFVHGQPIKAICRELGVSRKVVRKVIRSEATEFRYERETQPLPKMGPWSAELDRLLAANESKATRERLTLIRLFEELRGLGYAGGYDAVRRYARRWSRERGASTTSAYVPLSFAPGEAYQFDWSHEVVLLSGTTVVVKAAHVRLCHSRMLFVRAYPRETQEMVFDAHDRAFALFKGTCRRGIYDNMKTAVETIFVGKGRLYNRRFLQMCSHYLVDPVACTPASGWEKGQVENQVGLVRERFFTPRLRFRTLDELNAWLLDKCIAYAKAHRHPEFADRTVWEVFEAERPNLVPYAGRFDGFHAVPASVSKTCLVRFDNNKYSVAASAVGRPIEVQAYADRIVIRQDGRIVAEHPRSFGRGETVYDPWHYVPVLMRKPGALRNGAPFKDWVLPAAIERVRRKLAGVDDGNRQMVDILNAVLTDGLPAVEAACAEAVAHGVHSADVVLNILARQREPAPPANIMTPAALALRHAPIADCARYDNLRRIN